jgi:hypothetical protein
MPPDMFTRLRKIREGSGTGTYMLMNGDAGIAEGTVTGPGTTFQLLGVPVRVSTQVPGAQAGGKTILADMNQVAVGRDTAPAWCVHRDLRRLRPAISAGRGPLRHQAAERRRHLHHHHRLMAEQRAEKAPDKTVEACAATGGRVPTVVTVGG